MKEWKRKTGANTIKAWDNHCKNINCPNYDRQHTTHCNAGKNHRVCVDAIKYTRKGL